MTPRTLYRLAGIAGVIGGVLIIVAAARRNGIVAETALTHALAPPASALALFTLTALYLRQRARSGIAGLVGYALTFLGLTGLFAVEFATHAIFQYLDPATRESVLTGPGRPYFLVVAFTFLVGVLVFGVGSVRARVFPLGGVALFVLGYAPAALRTSVPEFVYSGGLVVGSLGLIWLAATLVRIPASELEDGGPLHRDVLQGLRNHDVVRGERAQ